MQQPLRLIDTKRAIDLKCWRHRVEAEGRIQKLALSGLDAVWADSEPLAQRLKNLINSSSISFHPNPWNRYLFFRLVKIPFQQRLNKANQYLCSSVRRWGTSCRRQHLNKRLYHNIYVAIWIHGSSRYMLFNKQTFWALWPISAGVSVRTSCSPD